MTPEQMTDDQLLEARTITQCTRAVDGGWNVVLSCGHELVFIILDPRGCTEYGCAQCLEILLQRKRRERSA